MPEESTSQELPGKFQTAAVLAFRNNNQEVLLIRHTAKARNPEGTYGLPAGQINLGESPPEAAVRELTEETGLKTSEENLHMYPDNYFSADIERHLLDPNESHLRHAGMIVYYCSEFVGEINKDNPRTIPEWVPISKISELKLMPNVDLAIENYFKTL